MVLYGLILCCDLDMIVACCHHGMLWRGALLWESGSAGGRVGLQVG